MKVGLSENFTAKITNALKESEKAKKAMKEDSYDETFFSDIEDALRNAGFDVTRFTDAGILTKNLGWVVENSEGEVQLSCDGTWLDEGLKEAFMIRYFWGDENGYVGRNGNEYTRTADPNKALKFSSEEEAEHNKEDIDQYFGGRAKLVVMKEAEDFIIDPFDKVGGDVKYILDGIDKLRKGLHSYESEKILDTILERVPEILKELGYTWGK